jgi:hypothetical protein
MAEALTGTIHKPGGAVPWAGAVLKGRCVRFFTDGTFTYPAHEFTVETDPVGAFETSLATPDNGAAEWEFTLPGGELLGPVFVAAGDGPLTLEDLAAGAGSPEQQDTLLTLLAAYLRKDADIGVTVLPVAADPVTVASSRDIASTDGGKLLEVTATAALNCPDAIGSNLQCAIISIGGTTTITADTTLQYLDGGVQTAASGVTVNTQCTLYHRGANVWLALGDVTPI